MPLTPGTRLGPHEIISPLGAGGNGRGLPCAGHQARSRRRAQDWIVRPIRAPLRTAAAAPAPAISADRRRVHEHGRDEVDDDASWEPDAAAHRARQHPWGRFSTWRPSRSRARRRMRGRIFGRSGAWCTKWSRAGRPHPPGKLICPTVHRGSATARRTRYNPAFRGTRPSPCPGAGRARVWRRSSGLSSGPCPRETRCWRPTTGRYPVR